MSACATMSEWNYETPLKANRANGIYSCWFQRSRNGWHYFSFLSDTSGSVRIKVDLRL